ncbi:hypothetical protein [Streptomyces sp. NBC_01320]|uniref:hypothetical protein n=1 Tax=Streptomyces sp. NBC_01320 TaxID=2903824 RepID=UPI002E0EE411|nr:hypothetical protein OG395_07750 [Streptomyces sp. NBC_01320]
MNLTIKRAVVTAVAAISVLAGSATVASAASPHGGPKHRCKHEKFNQHGKSTKIRHGGRQHHTIHLKGHRLPVKFLVAKGHAHRSH